MVCNLNGFAAGFVLASCLCFASAGTLVSEWTACSANLLDNPTFAWSNGSISGWEVYPAGAASPTSQGNLGPLEQTVEGFRISGSGDSANVDVYALSQTISLGTAISVGGQHFVLAVQALFDLSFNVECGTPCRASLRFQACSNAECSSGQILAADIRGAWLSGLQGYQLLHQADEPYEWHLLQLLAPAGTTHLQARVEALLVTGSVTVHQMCMRQVSSFDAVTWLMDRYYSHFIHAPDMDWSAAVQAARPDIVNKDPPLTEPAMIEAMKTLLARTGDGHVYLHDSAGTAVSPLPSAPSLNIDAALLPTSDGGLQFANAGMTTVTTDTLSAERDGEERAGDYLYVVAPSLAGGTGPDWGELIEEVYDRLSGGAASGLILDLRGNSGGDELRAESLSALLAAQDYPYKQVRYRAGNAHGAFSTKSTVRARSSANLFPDGNFQVYGGPVAVLLGPGCVSSCEGWALMLRSLPAARGPLRSFGAPTRGASGNPTAVTLDNGIQVVFSTWDVLALDDAPLELRGVAPDELVAWELEPPAGGYAEDPVLAAAVEWLLFDAGPVASETTTPSPSDSSSSMRRGVSLVEAALLCGGAVWAMLVGGLFWFN